ncbi:MAG: rod shape-determining protein MreD [Treponema sp.]|nr:rod shape-determining protein MreD [Treponema sp.]
MIKPAVWSVVFCLLASLLQSTLFSYIALFRAVPDLALCIVVYTAYVNGSMSGQVSGFFSGLLLDLMSAGPLGLNCFIRTLMGALAGLLKGNFFLDFFFLPMILCALATITKAAFLFILHLFLTDIVPVYSLTTPVFWVELALNCICAPFLFALLRRVKPLSNQKEKK